MSKKKKSYGTVAVVISMIILMVAFVGIVASFASNFGVGLPNFFLIIDEKHIAKDVCDYVISKDNSLNIELVCPLKSFSSDDYKLDVKANDSINFSIDVDGERHIFDNSTDWNQAFDIVPTKKGFKLRPVYDALDQTFAYIYGGESVEFYIPKDAQNLFCVTISSKDETIKYNVYFTLTQQFTVVSLDKAEILF